jgi:tetratricopeptide (TPR) repeat protein
MGKTRLARQYLAERGRLFDVGEGTLVAALARAIGTEIPDTIDDGLAYVADWLERHATLIVLDGVAPAQRDEVARLGELAPQLQLVVTRTEPLRIAGEQVLALLPLARDDAARLFLERAASFVAEPSPAELQAVDVIVERLEGIPLVIELTAGLTASLGLVALAARVGKSVAWLDRVAGNGVLSAALLEAWDQLAPAERSVLAACAIFEGFSADAAEAVLGELALVTLGRLVEKSLVVTAAGPDGQRFALRHLVRELVAQRDPPGPDLIARHAAYYLETGRALAAQITRTGDSHAQRLLACERGNLLAIAAADRPPEQQVEAILALDPILRGGEPHAEHHALLDRGVTLARATHSSQLAELLAARGELARRRGHVGAALQDFAEATALAGASGERSLLGRVMSFLAMMHHQAGQLSEAERLGHAAIACNRELGDSRSERISRITLGLVLMDEHRHDDARPLFEETIVLAQEAHDRFCEAMALGQLACCSGGRLDERRAQFHRARALAVEIGDRRTEALLVGWLATLEHESGQQEKARRGYLESIALLQISNGFRFEALIRGRLFALLADHDLLDEALAERDRALGMFRRVGDPSLGQSLQFHEGHLDLFHARQSGDPTHLEAVATLLEVPYASDEARVAHGLLQASFSAQRSDAVQLVVEKGGLRFRLGGPWVSLVRRRALGRLLHALAAAERGRPLSIATLIGHGWPGETLARDSGIPRVRMAIATLRKLGLKDVLLTSGDGYLLDPAVAVRLL